MRRSTLLLALALLGCPGPEVSQLPDASTPDASASDAAGTDAANARDVGPDAPSCADADGDGYASVSCGGTDCDDADATRAPGLTEVCDVASVDEDCDPSTFGRRDRDADGHPDATCCNGATCGDDCDDTRPDVFAGTTETCDMRDNDCDTAIDEGVLATVFADVDRDGYGVGSALMRCAGTGYASVAGDCDDTTPTVSPGATELCASAIDEDCDGLVDESGPRLFYRDADADGYGDPGNSMMTASCTPPAGYASNSRDCADGSAAVHPGATDLCNGVDDDCAVPGSGGVEPSEDRDMDRHSPSVAACAGGYPMDDCNDNAAMIYPGALEVCDGVDEDCSSGGGAEPSEDMDGDLRAPVLAACVGGTYPRDDCRDDDPSTYAGAMELCDARDNDCSSGGGAEPGEDMDGDLHAASGAACIGGSFARDDCDDGRASVHPGAAEICDGLDDDCAGGGGAAPLEDADGDMHSGPAAPCAGGFARDDCDDARASIYWGAAELCDRLDDDCSSGGGLEAAEDVDADGYAGTSAACAGGPLPRTDCDDTSAVVHPGASELCNRVDEDCSAGGGVEAAEDADLDGFAGVAASCAGGTLPRTDCDDARAFIHPGASELCNRIDDDCSSRGGAEPREDFDDDLHAPLGASCSGGARPRDDCNDFDPAIYAGSSFGAPRPLGPENGALTGSLHDAASGTLRPMFRWLPGSCGAVTYDLQIDDSCTTPGFGACTMPSPEVSMTGISGTSARPAADLAVSALAPVGRRYYWRVRACAGVTCGSWSVVRYVDVGRAVSDLNGDGWSDQAVGVPGGSAPATPWLSEGIVDLYYGSSTGLPGSPSQILENPANQAGGNFGRSLSSIGDVNADGYADLVVGAYLEDAPAVNEGNAFVFLGSATGIATGPSIVLDNPTNDANGYFGASVASAGDLNGDGYADVVVGADHQDAPTFFEGNVFVYLGMATGIGSSPSLSLDSPTDQPTGYFGTSVATSGDVNGDGWADLVVGAIGIATPAEQEGNVYVYLGTASIPAGLPTTAIDSPTGVGYAHFGTSVALRDTDGDGYADVVADGYTYLGSGAGISTVHL